MTALDDGAALLWLRQEFDQAQVDLFASTHTCLRAMRQFQVAADLTAWVVNNGAAGMPNFAGDLSGLCTRIGTTPSAHAVLHEVRVGAAYVALLPVRFDVQRWQSEFLTQWPLGSPAWLSYFERIAQGPAFDAGMALRRRIDDGPMTVSHDHHRRGPPHAEHPH